MLLNLSDHFSAALYGHSLMTMSSPKLHYHKALWFPLPRSFEIVCNFAIYIQLTKVCPSVTPMLADHFLLPPKVWSLPISNLVQLCNWMFLIFLLIFAIWWLAMSLIINAQFWYVSSSQSYLLYQAFENIQTICSKSTSTLHRCNSCNVYPCASPLLKLDCISSKRWHVL